MVLSGWTVEWQTTGWLCSPVVQAVVYGFGRHPNPRSGDVHEFRQRWGTCQGSIGVLLVEGPVMPQMPKFELYAAIRRDHRAGMKTRELERTYNVSWQTVKKAVDSVWPEPRKKLPPRPPSTASPSTAPSSKLAQTPTASPAHEPEPNRPQRADPLKPLDCRSGHLSGSASWRFSRS